METIRTKCPSCDTIFIQRYNESDIEKGYIVVGCPKCGLSHVIKQRTPSVQEAS